jgi:predicted phosphodiesterase
MAASTPEVSFDVAFASYQAWIGSSTHPAAPEQRGRPHKKQRIVAAGDFHVPFHSREALRELVTHESKHADLLVISGDLADCWATSRWPKSKRETDPRSEYLETQAVLTILAGAFKQIVIVGGNHDSRPRKYLADRLPVEVMDYLALTAPGALNPLALMSAEMSNVSIAPPIEAGNATFDFLYQVGDCVFSHAEAYSKIPNRAVSGPVLQWLMSFAIPQGIVQPFNCVVQAHTHQAGTVHGDFGILCVEGGSMCGVQSYQGSGKIQSTRPPVLGWSVILQTNGVTDIAASRFVPLTP